MMRSMLKQLQQGQRDQALLSFVDRAMRVEERQRLLESHHSQELSLLYILQDDYDRAKYYANYAMEIFMQVRQRSASTSLSLGQKYVLMQINTQSLHWLKLVPAIIINKWNRLCPNCTNNNHLCFIRFVIFWAKQLQNLCKSVWPKGRH